jgi:hypothetical protein
MRLTIVATGFCLFTATVARAQSFDGTAGTHPFVFGNTGMGYASLNVNAVPITVHDDGPSQNPDFVEKLTLFTDLNAATNSPATVLPDGSYSQPVHGFIEQTQSDGTFGIAQYAGNIIGKPGAFAATLDAQHDRMGLPYLIYLPFTLNLTSLTAPISMDSGGLLNSFSADISGTFATPEPAALTLGAMLPLLLTRRRL